MKYLIDSLQSYETGHGDALSPVPSEADQSFMGDHILVKPVTTEEFRMFTTTLLEALRPGPVTLGNPHHESHILQHHITALHSEITAGHHSDSTTSACSRPSNSQESHAADALVCPDPKPIPLPGVSIPDLGHAPDAWRKAIQQWEEPDPSTGYALKDWPVEWYTGVMRLKTGAKRSNRKLIAEEYQRSEQSLTC
jgi:hypothetical protein